MIRAFLDTNVLLDIELRRPAFLEPIKSAALDDRIEALVSFGVLEEIRIALEEDEDLRALRRGSERSTDDVLREVLVYTRFAGGFAFARRVLRRDPRDEPILAAALAGEARYLVTSNTADFEEAPSSITVLRPEAFLEILDEDAPDP